MVLAVPATSAPIQWDFSRLTNLAQKGANCCPRRFPWGPFLVYQNLNMKIQLVKIYSARVLVIPDCVWCRLCLGDTMC